MTLPQATDGDPGPLHRAAARLAAEGDGELWEDGYRAGFTAGADVGTGQALLEVKRAQHDIYDHLAAAGEIERQRWMLRGEPRTRGTFGQPHTGDFPGRGASK